MRNDEEIYKRMLNRMEVRVWLRLLKLKVQEGQYPVRSWEARELPTRQKCGYILRKCQWCGETIRTWNVHPDTPVSCNGISPCLEIEVKG